MALLAGDGGSADALSEMRVSASADGPAKRLLARVSGLSRIAFDLDGTLYDTRDFERPALAAVVRWVRERSGRGVDGLQEALWVRRESDRHRAGLFDELLREYGLPVSWGAECAARFHSYPGLELASSQSLRDELSALRSRDCRLALVTNGRAALQQRKLKLLELEELFDICIYCDPGSPEQLKPSVWAWTQLQPWRSGAPTGYVGDDPVDAQFAAAGGARFIDLAFRDSRYGN